jgi:hypothetical protein
MLGLGAASPKAALGAKATAHHGRRIFGANYACPLHGVRELYIGIVK